MCLCGRLICSVYEPVAPPAQVGGCMYVCQKHSERMCQGESERLTLTTCFWHPPHSHLSHNHTVLPLDTAIALCTGDWWCLLAQTFKAEWGETRRGVGWITCIQLWRHLANIRSSTTTRNVNISAFGRLSSQFSLNRHPSWRREIVNSYTVVGGGSMPAHASAHAQIICFCNRSQIFFSLLLSRGRDLSVNF